MTETMITTTVEAYSSFRVGHVTLESSCDYLDRKAIDLGVSPQVKRDTSSNHHRRQQYGNHVARRRNREPSRG